MRRHRNCGRVNIFNTVVLAVVNMAAIEWWGKRLIMMATVCWRACAGRSETVRIGGSGRGSYGEEHMLWGG